MEFHYSSLSGLLNAFLCKSYQKLQKVTFSSEFVKNRNFRIAKQPLSLCEGNMAIGSPSRAILPALDELRGTNKSSYYPHLRAIIVHCII